MLEYWRYFRYTVSIYIGLKYYRVLLVLFSLMRIDFPLGLLLPLFSCFSLFFVWCCPGLVCSFL